MLTEISQDELIPTLQKAGIKAREYSNPKVVGSPVEFFLTTEQGGTGLLIKKGHKIDLQIATNAKYNQSVLLVKEGKRKISKKVSFVLYRDQKVNDSGLERIARNNFNMVIPGAKLSVSNLKKTTHPKNYLLDVYTATVTASIDTVRTSNFLLGMDETSHFISVLPKKVTSVEEAHKLLRPKNIPLDAKRQGEFFFVPVKKQETFDKKLVRRGVPLEPKSNHLAQFAIPTNYPKTSYYSQTMDKSKYKGVKFVKGLIYDKRAYRHAPVDLGDIWHTVVRNNEVKVKPTIKRIRYD